MDSGDVVSKIMSKTVRTLREGDRVTDAIKIMASGDIGSVVITDGRRPVGIVTERDIVKGFSQDTEGGLQKAVGSVASKPLVTISPTTEVWEAFATMLKKGVRRLPVVEDGNLVGIVTERDLLRWVVGVLYEPNIPADVKKLLAQG